eukprot:c26739_g1_i1 orf=290-1570(-)
MARSTGMQSCESGIHVWSRSAIMMWVGVFVWILALFVVGTSAEQRSDVGRLHVGDGRHQVSPFLLDVAAERFQTAAGSVKDWSMQDVLKPLNLSPRLVRLRRNGMFLPKYSNAPELCYVVRGRAWSGLITPAGKATNIRYVKTGDILGIPKGWVSWFWNTGSTSVEMICVAETSEIKMPEKYTSFFLAGAKGDDMGGFLHGFSPDVLKMVWNINQEDVEKLLQSQKGMGLVVARSEAAVGLNLEPEARDMEYHGDFAINLLTARPTIEERGGWMSLLDRHRMVVTEELGLGASLVNLEEGGMFNPQWMGSSQAMYVTRGRGRVEMAYPNGSQAMGEEVKQGNLIIIPALFPHTVITTAKTGMQWMSFFSSSIWETSTLAGSDAVFGDTNRDILSASFNVSKDIERSIFHTVRDRAVLFPNFKESLM